MELYFNWYDPRSNCWKTRMGHLFYLKEQARTHYTGIQRLQALMLYLWEFFQLLSKFSAKKMLYSSKMNMLRKSMSKLVFKIDGTFQNNLDLCNQRMHCIFMLIMEPKSLQPAVVNLWYFKLWVLFDQIK